MNITLPVSFLLGGLMFFSVGITKFLTPTIYMAKSLPAINLKVLIPIEFDGWLEEKNSTSSVINPQSLELIDKIYGQTLSRTYINKNGERIMLSIAYGADQRGDLQVHLPEICYPAQGFQIQSNHRDVIITSSGNISVTRLEASYGSQRYEPITYWTTIGDKVITDRINRKIAEIGYGFSGKIPDGLIFRISSIDIKTTQAFSIQDSFVNSLVNILSSSDRKRLMGLN